MWSAILTMPTGSIASLVPRLDLPKLVDQSDLIVVGGISSATPAGQSEVSIGSQVVGARAMTATLDVARVLKGTLTDSRLAFQFLLPLVPVGYKGITSGEFGVFFLTKGPGGRQVLDGYHPFVAAALHRPASTGTYLDAVTSELLNAARSPETSTLTKRGAVDALGTLNTPAASAALEAIAKEADADSRALAAAALLERGKAELIGPAASLLLSPGATLDQYTIWRLSHGIEFIEAKIRDPKPVPVLARLLSLPNVTIRRAAAAALRETRAPAAIGPLSQALEDEDRDVQYQGVIGLAEITGTVGDWAPGIELFRGDPERYLKYWRDRARSLARPD